MTDAEPRLPDDGERPPSGTGTPASADGGEAGADGARPARARKVQRKSVLLRLDPAVHDALARWAADDLRSVNAQVEMLLRRALADAGRLPRDVAPVRRPGRPPRDA